MMRKRQSGATLVVSLIMLVILTLFAVSAINTSSVNLQVVGNMQILKTMESAAQNGIEQVISSIGSFNTPQVQPLTVDGYPVTVSKPQCLYTNPAKGYSALSGVAPVDTDWELNAKVNDPSSGAKAAIYQGVRIRLTAGACG